MKALPSVMERIAAVRKFRAGSKSAPTRKLAETPRRFHTEFIPSGNYLALPQVSSERREFIPIAFLDDSVLCGDKLRLIDHATLFDFGVLTSTMQMAWVRYVTGRLKSDYQYSAKIVYNNFPWPQAVPDDKRRAVAQAADAVLAARAAHPGSTLADLYDPDAMPDGLRTAHRELDKAVDAAYGYRGAKDDAARVAFLFALYRNLEGELLPTAKTGGKRRKRVAPVVERA